MIPHTHLPTQEEDEEKEHHMRPTADEFRAYEAVARADANYYRDLAENGRPEQREYHLKCAMNREEDADFYAFQATGLGDYLTYLPKQVAA